MMVNLAIEPPVPIGDAEVLADCAVAEKKTLPASRNLRKPNELSQLSVTVVSFSSHSTTIWLLLPATKFPPQYLAGKILSVIFFTFTSAGLVISRVTRSVYRSAYSVV